MDDLILDDLISRAWVLAEYDRQHQGPPGGARKIMEEAPAVDAVPVDFLMRYAQLPTEFAIAAWQKPNKELMKQKAKSYDKPMFFEEALQVVNNEYGERRDGET